MNNITCTVYMGNDAGLELGPGEKASIWIDCSLLDKRRRFDFFNMPAHEELTDDDKKQILSTGLRFSSELLVPPSASQ